jgi:hypothetical protein
MKFLFLSLSFLFFSCNNKAPHFEIGEEKELDGYLVKSNFIDDTLIHGTADFFKDNKLMKREQYRYGVKDGFSLNFYSNGHIYDSSTYVRGYKEGYYLVYDSLGVLKYKAYFYHNDQIGPETYFDNGSIVNYYFYSKDRKLIFSSWYNDSLKKINSEGNLYNFTPLEIYKGQELYYGVSAYFIYPPKFNISYELVAKKSGQEISLRKFAQEVFFDTTFLPNQSFERYFMKVNVYDSSTKKDWIYYGEMVYHQQG